MKNYAYTKPITFQRAPFTNINNFNNITLQLSFLCNGKASNKKLLQVKTAANVLLHL